MATIRVRCISPVYSVTMHDMGTGTEYTVTSSQGDRQLNISQAGLYLDSYGIQSGVSASWNNISVITNNLGEWRASRGREIKPATNGLTIQIGYTSDPDPDIEDPGGDEEDPITYYYYVSFEPNGASGSRRTVAADATYYFDLSAYEPSDFGWSYPGYAFVGWASSSNGSTITDKNILLSSDVTYYAIWKLDAECVIGFDANGGTDAPDICYVDLGTKYTIPSKIPKHNEKIFNYWTYQDSHGNTCRSYPGNTIFIDQNMHFVAAWRDKLSLPITFYRNFNTSDYESTSVIATEGNYIRLPYSIIFPRQGYVLIGWSKTRSGSIVGKPGRYFLVSDFEPLYAIWQQKTRLALFYWAGSDAADASKFVAGGDVSKALTAVSWNAMRAKINQLWTMLDHTTDEFEPIPTGTEITADEFNYIKHLIFCLPDSGTLPPSASIGGTVYASYFNGPTSLKSALNAAITAYNNSL